MASRGAVRRIGVRVLVADLGDAGLGRLASATSVELNVKVGKRAGFKPAPTGETIRGAVRRIGVRVLVADLGDAGLGTLAGATSVELNVKVGKRAGLKSAPTGESAPRRADTWVRPYAYPRGGQMAVNLGAGR